MKSVFSAPFGLCKLQTSIKQQVIDGENKKNGKNAMTLKNKEI